MQKILSKTFFLFLFSGILVYGQFMRQQKYWYPVHHAPDREFHMVNLALNFHFDLQKKEVMGTAAEKIVPLSTDLKAVHLNAVDMKIKSVKSNGKELKYEYDGKILTINFDKAYGLNDTLTYSVAYTTVPSKGIFFVLPDKGYPDITPQIWSQSEPSDARYWFPCHDFPDDFSTSSLTATVPADWVVVSNGLLKKVDSDKRDRTKTYYWVENKPHVVYLNSIVAGKFKILKAKWDNVPIYYYVEPNKVKDAKMDFARTPDILKYFSEVTGHHYEWDKLSLSTVTNFTEGGMENVSAITLTDNTLHGKYADPEVSTTDLVSHETAHQWFGDLLTCRSWAQTWLNEGFATYFEALYGRHAFGEDHFRYEMSHNHAQVVSADNRFPQPTVYRHYRVSDDVFNTYIYPRGASILDMLRGVVGEKQFFRSIKYYVKENQFKNVATHNLADAFRHVTGKNLYWFFNEWLYKGGHPDFTVTDNYDNTAHTLTMTVEQTQKIDSLTTLYKMPVDIYIVTPSGKMTKTVWVDSTKNTFTFSVPEKPLMVNFDENDMLLKEIKFKKSADELAYQVANDPAVTGRIWAAEQIAKMKSDNAVEVLTKALKNDSFWGVRAECATELGKFKTGGVQEALLAALKDKDPRVITNAVNSLSHFKNEEVAKSLRGIYKKDKNYYVRAAAVASLARVDSVKALPEVENALKQSSYEDMVKSAALGALTSIDSVKGYDASVKFSAYGQPNSLRLRAMFSLSRSTFDKAKTRDLFEKYVNDPYWIVRLISIDGLGRLGNENTLPLLKKREKVETNFRVVEAAQRAVKEIEARAKKKSKS